MTGFQSIISDILENVKYAIYRWLEEHTIAETVMSAFEIMITTVLGHQSALGEII
jgi:hypothetical protein